MNKNYYPTQKTFVKFDDEHFLLYLNEEVVEDYLPENAEAETQPFTAFAYSGTEEDGSTKVKAAEATYEQLVAGLIRTQYSVSKELALHRQRDLKPEEFTTYNNFCEQCKSSIALLLE